MYSDPFRSQTCLGLWTKLYCFNRLYRSKLLMASLENWPLLLLGMLSSQTLLVLLFICITSREQLVSGVFEVSSLHSLNFQYVLVWCLRFFRWPDRNWIKPRMLSNFLKRWSIDTFRGKKSHDEILEFPWQGIFFINPLEVGVDISRNNFWVIKVLGICI